MKQVKFTVKMCLVALAFGGLGTATAETQDGFASATVLIPIVISEDQALLFGDFAVGTVGGAVTVTSLGFISADADIDLVTSTSQQAKFSVTGEPSQNITVSVGGAATLSDGTNTMSLATSPQATLPTAFDGFGDAAFDVGGVLTVSASQTPGTYNTTNAAGSAYVVTITYD